MKAANRAICISSFLVLCLAPVDASARTFAGKWQIQGEDQAFHFSEEGAFAHQFADRDPSFGVWYFEDDMLAIVYVQEESLLGFNVLERGQQGIVLQHVEDESTITLNYLGVHEIPGDYVSMVADHFGNEAGEQDAVGEAEDHRALGEESLEAAKESATISPHRTNSVVSTIHNPGPFFVIEPGNLSLVGSWVDTQSISDPMVFDEHGFFKKGSFEGDYIYEDLGLYQFDGRTLTVHFFKSAVNYSAGDIVSFEISKLGSSSLTIDFGGHAADYAKSDKYRITETNRNEIRSRVNHQALENTWWDTGSEQYLFLAPDLVITRKNGRSDFHTFGFEGNELKFRVIDAGTRYESFGEVTSWNDDAIVFDTRGGRVSLRPGKGEAGLSADESNYYRNYVIATQNVTIQALLGVGQGMDIIEVEWKH